MTKQVLTHWVEIACVDFSLILYDWLLRADEIAQLKMLSEQIQNLCDDIQDAVGEIAFQTNFLALNAAVESAVAEEAGGRVCGGL